MKSPKTKTLGSPKFLFCRVGGGGEKRKHLSPTKALRQGGGKKEGNHTLRERKKDDEIHYIPREGSRFGKSIPLVQKKKGGGGGKVSFAAKEKGSILSREKAKDLPCRKKKEKRGKGQLVRKEAGRKQLSPKKSFYKGRRGGKRQPGLWFCGEAQKKKKTPGKRSARNRVSH